MTTPSENDTQEAQVDGLLRAAHIEEIRLTTECREELCDYESARKHDYAAELLGRLRYELRKQPTIKLMDAPLNAPESPVPQQARTMQRMVRRGWRHFHCSECEHRWKWPSRDALSPSGENCPRCDEWCFPYHSKIDATIPCDDMGNLTVPWNWTGQAPNEKLMDAEHVVGAPEPKRSNRKDIQ